MIDARTEAISWYLKTEDEFEKVKSRRVLAVILGSITPA
jgi:hypothetical protein